MGEQNINRTQSEAEFCRWFAFESKANMPKATNGLAAKRWDAFDRFQVQGLPHRRFEAYKYTDLRAKLATVPPAGEMVCLSSIQQALSQLPALEIDASCPARIVIVNGRFVAEASDLANLEDGLWVGSLSAFWASSEGLADKIGVLADDVDDPMVALNTALFEDGVVINVAEGVKVSRPIDIVHIVTGGPLTTMPRHALFLGQGASVRVVERHEGLSDAANLTNATLELFIAPRAELTWAKLQAEGIKATHVGSTVMAVGEGARVNHLTINLGAALTRSQLFVDIDGENTETTFDTATFATAAQHVDTTLVIDHKVPNGISRERFRSVVDDQAKTIVQGRINVWPQAQKTDARMMSNALLLSEQADVVNKPELEIYADDVQCAHGATSGQIDEEALFYLRSRGIEKRVAERLLIESFVLEAVEGLQDDILVAALCARVQARMEIG